MNRDTNVPNDAVECPGIAVASRPSHSAVLQSGEPLLARYILRATGVSGPVEFRERHTIEAALEKAQELRDAHFSHITILNVLTGVEISDVEALLVSQGSGRPTTS